MNRLEILILGEQDAGKNFMQLLNDQQKAAGFSKQHEIEFLENSIQSQRESYDEELKHAQDSELQLKRRNNEFQAEIKDLRDQIVDLKSQIDDLEQAGQLSLNRLSLDGSNISTFGK